MTKSDRMMPTTGPMALPWAGLSSEGGLVISARGRTGRGGHRQPRRNRPSWGGGVIPRALGGVPHCIAAPAAGGRRE